MRSVARFLVTSALIWTATLAAALETILKAIDEAGIANRSVVIITADHGGHGKTHGSRSPDDMSIPWIVWGEGVKKGLSIPGSVTTCDTTATTLWLLDVPGFTLPGRPGGRRSIFSV